jgi:uncharacterized membrane protein YsdA (DUF1294 family)/cold shock CspA family protein
MRANGKIVSWDSSKGCGYAMAKAGGSEIFIESKNIDESHYQVVVGQQITFTIQEAKRGLPTGHEIQFVGNKVHAKSRSWYSFTWGAILLLLAFGSWLYLEQIIAVAVFVFYGLLSAISFSCYYIDKRAARKDLWRLKESTLQLSALLGGWPGALIAQGVLRHKIRKPLFLFGFYFIVSIHLGLLFFYLSEQGNVMIRSLLINAQFEIAGNEYVSVLQVWWWKIQRFLGF